MQAKEFKACYLSSERSSYKQRSLIILKSFSNKDFVCITEDHTKLDWTLDWPITVERREAGYLLIIAIFLIFFSPWPKNPFSDSG